MNWTFLKITATVETARGTLTFDFEPTELIGIDNDEIFDVISMKEWIEMIDKRVRENE